MAKKRGRSMPREVSIAITGRCNLKCNYCFYADEMTSMSDLPTSRWLDFVEELGRIGVMHVSLTGGEAFTRPDLFEIIDSIITNRMRYNILSNGTLIDEKTIRKLETGKRRLRLDYIQVSIDGSCAEIHDKSRPNSFDKALRGLRLLKGNGFPIVVRVTINKHNLNDLENIAHLLLDDVGLASFSTNDAMPIGSGCKNAPEIGLTALERLQAMETIKKLLERYPERITGQAGPRANLDMYAEMEHARKTGEKTTRWQMGYLSACGCIFSKLDVFHDGTIIPCHMLPELTLGKIGSDSLEEIWLTHPTLNAMRKRRSTPMQQVPGCENCEWAPFCNGGCPGLSYHMLGDFNLANPHDCYRRFLAETGGHSVVLD